MRIVWASIHRPDPTRGGGWSHAYELLADAAKRHELTIVTLAGGEKDPGFAEIAAEVVEVGCRPRPTPRSRVAYLSRAARGPGTIWFWQAAPCVEAIGRAAAEIETQRRADLVHLFAGEMAPALSAMRGRTALMLTDAYGRQGGRDIALAPTAGQRLLRALEAWHARRWERTRYTDAGALACVSEEDAAAIRAATRRKDVDVIPPPIGRDFFAEPDRPRARDLVSFIGALDYRPNIDALRWLVTEIWPAVLRQRPAARLRVAGRDATREAIELVGSHPVEFHPDVPDIRPEYWEAAVVVQPIRLGSGVKNKALHAMACGTPLVGTPFAFEGIGLRPGEHVLIATDPTQIAAALVETLDDPAAAAARAARAKEVAMTFHSGSVGRLLDRFWERAASAPLRRD